MLHRLWPTSIAALAAASRNVIPLYGNLRAVRPVIRLLHNPRSPIDAIETIVSIGSGQRVLVNTHNLVEWDVFFTGFEPEVRRLFARYIRPGHNAIDIGANVGVHTIAMAQAVRGGVVLACEPNPDALVRLRKNLSLNQISNVRVCEMAVSDQDGTVELYVPLDLRHTAGASLRGNMHKHLEDSQPIFVPSTTIDRLVRSHHLTNIDFIKVDVEGFEGPVLRGAKDVLAREKPAIVFEYTQEWWQKLGYTLPQVVSDLRAVGYGSILHLSRCGLRRLPNSIPGRMNVFAAVD